MTTEASAESTGHGGLTKKRRVRGGHRGHITRVLKKSEQLLDNLQPSSILQLKQHKLILEEQLKATKELDNQILDLLSTDQEIDNEIVESAEFCDSVYEIIVRIDEQLKISESQQKDKDGPTVSSAVSEDSVTSYGGAKAKLPKLVIKKFYGEAHLWQELWDSFKFSIDDNKNLSTIDKFNYLKNLLESNAYSTIAGLSLTAANYSTALDLLHKRYGQKQIIVNSHIDSIPKMQPLHYNAEIAQVRKFYDTVETHSRGLKALGVESSSYGTVLVNILLQRLPDEIKLIISRKMNEVSGDDNWNLDTLLDILKTEVEAREKCMITSRKQYPQGVPNKKPYRNTSIPATTSALFASSKNRNQTCTFCRGQHPTAQCHVVTDIRERRNILRRQGRSLLSLLKESWSFGQGL